MKLCILAAVMRFSGCQKENDSCFWIESSLLISPKEQTELMERIYFCIHLGETEGADISSARAREIAVRILQEEVSPS
ncbi:hypothetical protein H6B11_15420 [Mediterraneibacter glycyrrhizinilyticus]|nr:hypothetical protein [Mediterraneibacter glycyrrhizinilyticus]MBM6855517.1 hypothetical protein [Mediterraneibacter glycyrrhizinilyticus]